MPIPDKFHHLLKKFIEKGDPRTPEEVQKMLDSLKGKKLDELFSDAEPLAPQEHAREMVWQAQGMPVAKGRKLAMLALEEDPDCIEAYEYLGYSHQEITKRAEYLHKGALIGWRIFGGDFMEQHEGNFWLMTETRPFMRCMAGICECLEAAGQIRDAIPIQERMLSLNPNDSQGMRYPLLSNLLTVGDFVKYNKYRKQYDEESTMMGFNDALAAFAATGADAPANDLLWAAMTNNRHVPDLLLAPAPPETVPGSYTFNSKEEAATYADLAWKAWKNTPGALAWLEQRWETDKPRLEQEYPAPPLLPKDINPGEALFTYLSPTDRQALVFGPLEPPSPLLLRPGLQAGDVQDVKMLRFVRQFLLDVQAGQPLKLTQKGNLPRAFVQNMYAHRIYTSSYVDDGHHKLLREDDFSALHLAHMLTNMAGLVKKKLNKLSLTKAGTKILGDDAALYTALLKTYTSKYNWAYMTYDDEDIAQIGWAYSMLLLLTYGGAERPAAFYADQYFALFPQLLEKVPDNLYYPRDKRILSCFTGRFFNSFCNFFGLAEIRDEKNEKGYTDQYFIKKSPLAEKVFMVAG